MSELPKAYQPQEYETAIYRRWEASGYFNPDKLPQAKRRKPFVISMPPSNITGELHIGHAVGFTIQDILIRYHRMRGRAALWLPGNDHAAIATQVLVDRQLRAEGIDRFQLGRKGFLERVWAWKEKYGDRIVEQTKRLGASADWSRLHFTMDEDCTRAVNAAFKKLYRDKLIYRGERIVNWCPECRTAISDLEVDHEDTPGKLWYLKYPLVSGRGHIVVATTRPETMLGDTAVAVHPKDGRYRDLVGQLVRLPIVDRQIPIVADELIDRGFGTGAVKVTPAHDPLDYELGQTHHLPRISVIGQDGNMTAAAGSEFRGLSVNAARELVIKKLQEQAALDHEEDYIHAVATCSRSKTVIEPLVSLQWFVKTGPLAKLAIRAVRQRQIKIVPRRFEKIYFQWLTNIRDWNISRQIWWGHRLPVWYKTVKGKSLIKVSDKKPGPGWVQDEDTLDTWFSSGLWTFSTLGWPHKTSDLKRFHPTDVMETAWDILFFWVARMSMLSLHLTKRVPFRLVYLHGLVLDRDGKKMSRSKGTGLDPVPMIDRYGADALRMSLVTGNAVGQDFRLSEKKIEAYRNFANKLWNVGRYVLSRPVAGSAAGNSVADDWIRVRLNRTIAAVTAAIERYDFSAGGQALYEFVWHELADWYLEAEKLRPNPALLRQVFLASLRLLHPFMPFITERLWQEFGQSDLLMVATWPRTQLGFRSELQAAESFDRLRATVVALRNFRVNSGLNANTPGSCVTVLDIELLGRLSRVALRPVKRLDVNAGYGQVSLGQVNFQFPAERVEKYHAWRAKEHQQLTDYIAGLRARLANDQFVNNAPRELVAQERDKLAAAEKRLLEI